MNLTRLVFSALAMYAVLSPASGWAQAIDTSPNLERVDRLERDVMLLQRQLARGTPPTPTGGTIEAPVGSAAGQLEIRLSTIEEQLRDLRGKTEENENLVRKLSESMEKMQRDIEFRFNEINHASGSGAPAPYQKTPEQQSFNIEDKPETTPLVPDAQPPAAENSSSGSGKDKEHNFSSPREHYNYAFRLLNQTQYEEAAALFESFTKKYPKDPLVGNAFYWGGETYYIRRDYVNAADNFRQGFEALPDGPKAADNLLKLAMSLNALGRDKEGCLVLQKVSSKFKKSAPSVADKAEQEIKRVGCRSKS